MQSNTQLFLDFSAQLYKTASIDDMFALLEQSIVALGFDNVSYTYLPRVLATSDLSIAPVFKISTDYNRDFIEHYSKAGFAKHDFTIKRILKGDLSPIDWWQEQNNQQLSSEESEVIRVAREDYQIRNGLSLPTFSDGYSLAGLSLVSEANDTAFAKLCRESTDIAHQMAFMFSDRVLNRADFYGLFYQPFTNQLSNTEKRVLIGLSEGLNVKEIAENIGRDYKYISNFVLDRLRKKFGNVSRDKLLFEAGANRIDQLLNQ